MKRWTKRIGMVLTTLLLLVSQASWALARGGGGLGGSLGGSAGRSFGGSFSGSGGGFSGGGLSGGFGGFNSFFPFFFFGGSSLGGSSGGLFSLVFMLIIFYLIFKTLRKSNQWRQGGMGRRNFGRPFYPGSGPRPLGRGEVEDLQSEVPVDLSGREITNAANLQRFGKAISFTRENMQYYAQTFPRWDRDFLVGRVRQVFFWLQDAWSRQDLSHAPDYLVPALVDKYRADLEGMKVRGERNMIKDPELNAGDLEFIHCHLDEGNEHVVIMVYANLIDYTVDSSGRQISGDERNKLYFTEFWEFSWQGENWVLANIFQEDSLEVAKIARGDY